MGAVAKQLASNERSSPLFFFGKLQKLDRQISGREPASLFERMRRIAVVEGAGEEEGALSTNEVRVWLATWGADLHEWMQKHEEAVGKAARSETLYPQQVIFTLLEEALAAREGKALPKKK